MTITRRLFLHGTAVLAGGAMIPFRRAASARAVSVKLSEADRTIVGYGYPWTARPGGEVDFMVSTYADGPYRADLVRIICGDALSSPEMFKEEEVAALFAGEYPGRKQQTFPGSYVEIAPAPVLDQLSDFTVQAFVYPTLLAGGSERRGSRANDLSKSETGAAREQVLVARWNAPASRGWALLVDADHRVILRVGDGAGAIHEAKLDRPLLQDRWFRITTRYDAVAGSLSVEARRAGGAPAEDLAWPAAEATAELPNGFVVPQEGTLRFAAATGEAGNGERARPALAYSGKLDSVRLASDVLSEVDAAALSRPAPLKPPSDSIVGYWDFSKDIGTTKVHDLSGNGLHGVTVNAPDRAVTGVRHDGRAIDWRLEPQKYGACHFHRDDLYDAEWKADFSFTVPAGLPSGIYAARLRHGESEDYIPFFVAPPRGKPAAKVALLLPTFNYLAYTNLDLAVNAARLKTVKNEDGTETVVSEGLFPIVLSNEKDNEFLVRHPEIGRGVYRSHDDGTACRHASMKYPNMTTKPKGIIWTLCADTYITDWLAARGIDADILTDELLHAEGAGLLRNYSVVMTGNHPEYYTEAMQDAVEEYLESGGRWMYLGGNGFFWVTSAHAELPGLIEVRKGNDGRAWNRLESVQEFDGHPGGLWQANGRPPQRLMGVGMKGEPMENCTPYDRLPDSDDPRAAFIFEGVEERVIGDFGLIGGGAAGQEVDGLDLALGSPAHTLRLATSRAFRYPLIAPYGMTADEYQVNYPMPKADLTFYETPSGGGVFSVGSMAWVGALSHARYRNNVSRITENVLRRFMHDTPIPLPSAVSSSADDDGSAGSAAGEA